MPKGVYFRTEATRKKISEARMGKKLSEKTKRKLSEIHKRIGTRPLSRKGIILSEELKKKLSKIHKKIGTMPPHPKGKDHPNWKGGFSLYPIDWTETLKESIRQRDNCVCQLCGIHQGELKGFHKKLDVHHIDYNKDNLNPDNLISLCKSCHLKTNYNREYWLEYFQQKEVKI